ncbi:hypothetical protein O181_105231 [Austropuccinia psidii MF-1]|uniref:Uncharacterized protein n=1 Tax=Austropuccinia psidii MF-1 TaxID=1389203 RepID=A0A9Q3JNP6_9BASI|nr:hypothetical protein [Austropuccinia psidii MF-1]
MEPLLIPSHVPKEPVTVAELGTGGLVVLDEIHTNQSVGSLNSQNKQADVVEEVYQLGNDEESSQEHQTSIQPRRLKIIGPRHPTLISCDLVASNVIPYSRQPKGSYLPLTTHLALIKAPSTWPIRRNG